MIFWGVSRADYANQYSQDRNMTRPINPMASKAVFAVSPRWMECKIFFIKEIFRVKPVD
jgi:hypothetical protein